SPSAASGTVQFYNGAALLGSATLSGGQAQLATTTLPAGSNSLTASYRGDAGYAPDARAIATQVVRYTTTVALNSAPNPSTFASAVTLTATVSPSTASGAVQFYNGAILLGSGTLSGGHAQLATTALPAGSNSLTASYLGDGS